VRLGDYYAITTCVLGLIESIVSAFEQKVGLIGGYREGGNADGGGHRVGKFSRPRNVAKGLHGDQSNEERGDEPGIVE
jgi:hypothetical protein